MVQATSNLTRTKVADATPVRFSVINDRIAIRPDKFEEYTAGGIALPSRSKEEQQPIIGTVVAVGEGHWDTRLGKHKPLKVGVGSRVMFEKFVGNLVEINEEPIKIIREADVLCVLPSV